MSSNLISTPLSNLYCAEDSATIFEEFGSDATSEFSSNPQLITSEKSDYGILSFGLLPPLESEEFLDELFDREIRHTPCTDYLNRFTTGELDSNARKNTIDWITKVHSYYKFGPLTLLLSINYMDRFLSVYELLKDTACMMHLVAVACLSLAAKMEEIDVPLSPGFQEMELLILSTLEWRMQSVTPFSFLDYFVFKVCGDQMPPMCFLSKAIQLTTSITKGIEFLEFRASEIAASVTILLAIETKTIKNIHKAICFLSGRLKEEVVMKCVKMIQSSSSVTAITSDYEINSGASVSSTVLECPRSLSSNSNSKFDYLIHNLKKRKQCDTHL